MGPPVAHQPPLSMDFPGKNTGVGCHFLLPPGDIPDPGALLNPEIEPVSPSLQADSLPVSHQGSPFRMPTSRLVTKVTL